MAGCCRPDTIELLGRNRKRPRWWHSSKRPRTLASPVAKSRFQFRVVGSITLVTFPHICATDCSITDFRPNRFYGLFFNDCIVGAKGKDKIIGVADFSGKRGPAHDREGIQIGIDRSR
jgi:hypothetical protein